MATTERTVYRSGSGRHRRYGLSLPAPPTDVEKVGYTDRNLAVIIRTSLASFGALLLSQARFVFLSTTFTWLFLPFIVFTVAYYVISLYVNLGTHGFDQLAHRNLVSSWRPSRYPSLDVFLPVCGEPTTVLANTWSHVSELIRAYPGVATAYVLDDGTDERVRTMAEYFQFNWIARPDRGWMKKAGNLRYGFAHSSGEFVLILDADFAPRVDLPAEMLPYFDADHSLGIVQSPQFFRTRGRMSWMERGAGAVQELFYRLVQVSRDQHDGAICVGSCAIYRREALMANGGTTLIEHSEDVHTGFDLRRAGWGLRYIPVPLAAGLCPSDPDSFLTQQYRWCAGSMSLLGSRKFWTTRMRWRTRCCYLSGFCYYVHTALFTFAAPAIPLVMLIFIPDRVRLVNYIFIVPSMIYNLIVFPAWHRCRFGPEALMAKLLYGWAHLFALWDICRRRRMGWQTTGGGKRKKGTRRIWIGVTFWNGSTGFAWVTIATWRMMRFGPAFIPLFGTGLLAFTISCMTLGARRNHARVIGERTR
jgi:cellulose synthase/poly-beta-1,6-N-acetylglucosamine synthase-like glycosyltransferase